MKNQEQRDIFENDCLDNQSNINCKKINEYPYYPIGRGASIFSGFAFKSQDFCDYGIPIIKIKNVNNRTVNLNDTQFIPEHKLTSKIRKYILNDKDVLIAMTGQGSVGRVGQIRTKNRFLLNQRVGKFTVDENILNKDYLFYVISSPTYEKILFDAGYGSGQPNLSPDTIQSIEIPYPPYEKQVIIGKILSTIDDKIELNRQINQTLEAMAQAIFKSWFVDFEPVKAKIAAIGAGEDVEGVTRAAMSAISGKTDEELDQLQAKDPECYIQLKTTAELFPAAMHDSELGKIPEGWDIKTIDSIAKKVAMGPFGSNIKVSTFVERGVPIISGQHLHETLLTESTYNYITEEHAKKLANSCVSTGDVIFTHAGNIGQVSLIPSTTKYAKYVISQRQFYLRPDTEQITSSYLVYFFRSNAGQHLLLANASQVGVPSISRPSSYLKSIEIVVPAKSVLNQFENVIEALIGQIANNRKEIECLSAIRDTLLPKLLSGELSVETVDLAEEN